MARASLAALLAASTSHIAYAQDASGDAPPPDGTVVVESDGTDQHVYTPADFARFKPNTALDMLEQVPGFQISQQNQGRGLGQASENVLINGERIASKSDSAVDRLARTSATQVQRIEIVDGASFGIPGLSGQVANVIIETGAISGNFSYNMRFRPEFAAPSWGSGEVAINGKSGNIEWNAALQHGAGRGGAGDGPGVRIFDADDNLLETRRILIKNVGEYPRVRGGLKWDGPGSMVATINADYGQNYSKNYNYEWRTPVGDVPYFRDFLNRDEGYNYNINADVDFAFGPGRLKLIGIPPHRYPSTKTVAPTRGTCSTPTASTANASAAPNTGGICSAATGNWTRKRRSTGWTGRPKWACSCPLPPETRTSRLKIGCSTVCPSPADRAA